jgi:hypothetical protein
MSPELKAKWLAALRSQKYQQGNGTLHRGNTFCCLGVLCDVAGYAWHQDNAYDDHFKCAAGEDWIQNDAEAKKLGLPDNIQKACYSMNDGTFGDRFNMGKWDLTDSRPYSFTEIADWLEKHL